MSRRTSDAIATVRQYLDTMERRELAAAEKYLAEGFELHFPGADPMTTLDQLIAWSKGRYQHVQKSYGGIEAYETEGGSVVIARGTLQGAWPDGNAFSGVRFIDRFELQDGKIKVQEVWNDLAEVKGQT
jgi:limonene-1,2-epoxide hydrolase